MVACAVAFFSFSRRLSRLYRDCTAMFKSWGDSFGWASWSLLNSTAFTIFLGWLELGSSVKAKLWIDSFHSGRQLSVYLYECRWQFHVRFWPQKLAKYLCISYHRSLRMTGLLTCMKMEVKMLVFPYCAFFDIILWKGMNEWLPALQKEKCLSLKFTHWEIYNDVVFWPTLPYYWFPRHTYLCMKEMH